MYLFSWAPKRPMLMRTTCRTINIIISNKANCHPPNPNLSPHLLQCHISVFPYPSPNIRSPFTSPSPFIPPPLPLPFLPLSVHLHLSICFSLPISLLFSPASLSLLPLLARSLYPSLMLFLSTHLRCHVQQYGKT